MVTSSESEEWELGEGLPKETFGLTSRNGGKKFFLTKQLKCSLVLVRIKINDFLIL